MSELCSNQDFAFNVAKIFINEEFELFSEEIESKFSQSLLDEQIEPWFIENPLEATLQLNQTYFLALITKFPVLVFLCDLLDLSGYGDFSSAFMCFFGFMKTYKWFHFVIYQPNTKAFLTMNDKVTEQEIFLSKTSYPPFIKQRACFR